MTEAASGQFIDGAWRTGSGPVFSSFEPASGALVFKTAAAGGDDVRAAFQAARRALPGWARTPFEERRAVLERYAGLLTERKDAFAALIARETGKPLWESESEAGALIAKVKISVDALLERAGERAQTTAFGAARLAHKPIGVMFVLGPYNFPAHLPNGHIVPALLAGNTVVFKPSEQTPAVGALMVQALADAGVPAGVVNLVQGAHETGAAAFADRDLDGVLFTGSWATGSFIHKTFAGRTGVQLALEMGGNNPLVIWDAADADAAARVAILSAYISAGQRCSCARRLIVPAGAAGDAVIERLIELAGRLTIGRWDAQPQPFMGCLISPQAADGVLAAQDDLIAAGARALLKARRHEAGGAFLTPGLVDVTGVDTPDEEVFGPLLQVRRAPDFDAAIALANATAYGLSAALVSDDPDLWARFWSQARAGIVNWNRPTAGAASNMPFGGPGKSGNLRPSAYYAADYCAYPVASQIAPELVAQPIKGL